MSFNFILPTEITDSLFIGSNVPENDYQEYDSTAAYILGDTVMVATSTADVHKIYQCLVSQSAGLTPDLLDEECNSFGTWTKFVPSGPPASTMEISPTGQFHLKTAVIGDELYFFKTITTPPNTFTIEMRTYFDTLGTMANNDWFTLIYVNATWRLSIYFCSDGLYVTNSSTTPKVASVTVKSNTTAAWQTFRFQVTKTVESTATVAIYVDNVLMETVDCDLEIAGIDGRILFQQDCTTTNNMECHIDYIKIATGLGAIESTGLTPVGSTNWLEISATNRWKAFDEVVGSQTSLATPIQFLLAPGAIDSVALLGLESTTVQVIETDTASDLVTNGTSWTGATGTTQPTSWDKVGSPSAFLIEDGALKITTADVNEGISQTITVSAATEYQICGLYKNAGGDNVRYIIYDATHSADIVAVTDLPSSSAAYSMFSVVFTTPAGCTSVKISILAKIAIIWIDTIRLMPTVYNQTITTGTSKTDVVKTDLTSSATCLITAIVNKAASTAKIGALIVGVKTTLGTMKWSPAIGIIDYSTKEVDTFGNYSIVQRSFAKRLNCNLTIPNTIVDEVYRLLSLYRSTPLVWVGSESYSCLIIYGFYKEFSIVIPRKISSDCSLEIEGLT